MTISTTLSWVLGSWGWEDDQEQGMVSRDWGQGAWCLSGSLCPWMLSAEMVCVCGPREVCSASPWSLLLLRMPSETNGWASNPGERNSSLHPTARTRFN